MSVVKFKVGDKVKVLNTEGMGQGSPADIVGEIGTVAEVHPDTGEYKVTFEGPSIGDYWYYEDDNLGPGVADVFYVVDEGDSSVLSEHSNQDAAEADAKACAEQTDAHDGIGVYKRIVVYKTRSELVEERA